MSSDQTLAPCPFCGSPATRFTIEDDRDPNHGGNVITCSSCHACTRVVFGEKAGLADLWNRRAVSPSAWLGRAGLYRTRFDAVRNFEQSVAAVSTDELFELASKQVLDRTDFADTRTHGDYLVSLAGYKAGTAGGEERECQRLRPINAEGYKAEISTLLPGISCAGAAGVHDLNQAEGCKPDLSIRPSTPEEDQRLRMALQCMGAANLKHNQYHLHFLAEREEKDQLLEEALDAAASVGMHDLVDRINNALATDTSEMSPSPALVDVFAERCRQIDLKSYTAERDDQYANGELSDAAAAYAFWSFTSRLLPPNRKLEPPTSWPWDREHWKPTTQRHMLVKAGALILAELERLDRQQAREVAHG